MAIYSAADVGRHLHISPSTVRAWTFGTTYGSSPRRKRFAPVIHPASKDERRLSFVNLVEVHVLNTLRKRHGLRLESVRSAVAYLEDKLGIPHPLSSQKMQTNGADLFVERYGSLLNASQEGQREIRDAISLSLTRIDRDSLGESVRLFPFSRTQLSIEAPKHVAIDPRHRFGRPFLVRCGVDTEAVMSRYLAGESIESLSVDFRASVEEIQEAIRYHAAA